MIAEKEEKGKVWYNEDALGCSEKRYRVRVREGVEEGRMIGRSEYSIIVYWATSGLLHMLEQ